MVLEQCLQILKKIGSNIRERLIDSIISQSAEAKSAIHKIGHDDIIYRIDKDVEDLIFSGFLNEAEKIGGVIIIAEGFDESQGHMVLPHGMKESDAKVRVIIDPIDGTRGLMYDKRSAFFLAAVAHNKGENTRLSDIESAIMMELPTSKAYLCDNFCATRGQGVKGWRTHLLDKKEFELFAQPSKSNTIFGGFAQFSRFFSPGKDIISAIEEQLITSLFPNVPDGQAFVFEDQYISTGGQFYELLMGHDRFTADIRGSLYKKFKTDGRKTGLACHPYDVSAALILEEAGVVISNLNGEPLDCPLDTTTNVDWVAFANTKIKEEVWPMMRKTFATFELL